MQASRSLFDELDDHATLLGEVSCMSKRSGRLIGHAKDAFAGILAMRAFLPHDHWRKTNAGILFLGAGGATVALTTYLLTAPIHEQPSNLVITDVDEGRIRGIRTVHDRIPHDASPRYVLVQTPSDNDVQVHAMGPRSVVVNGTGMGKDRPGSPISPSAIFPEDGYAWDYNYRGNLTFLEQAGRGGRGVTPVDGWDYFLYGWISIIAEVFDLSIPLEGPVFQDLSDIAARHRRP